MAALAVAVTLAVAVAGACAGDEPAPKRIRAAVADWSNLQPDLIRLISSKLNVWEYLSFRGVCSSWRFAASLADRPQVPLLLLPYELDSTVRSFFDPINRAVHTVDLPETHGKRLCGTPFGWFVVFGQIEGDDCWCLTVFLFNPVTRARINFPPLPPDVASLRGETLATPSTYDAKTVLSANPTSATDSNVVLGLLIDSARLAFFRLGGDGWTVVELGVPSAPHRLFIDLAYLDGAFYVVDNCTGVTVFHIDSLKKVYKSPNTTRGTRNGLHLVLSCGELLLFERTRWGENVAKIYKLDRSCRKLRWVRAGEKLGDRAFFVSNLHSSMSFPCLADFAGGGRRDVLCFTGDDTVANVSISDIVAGSSFLNMIYYWEGAKRDGHYPYMRNYIGLTWIMPNLIGIELPSRVDPLQETRTAAGGDSTEGEEEPSRKWQDLPPNVQRFISRSLTGIFDNVRFRGVCPLWRSAVNPSNRRPQLPILLIPYDLGLPARSFFDPADRQVHTINISESIGKWLYGTPYGWLVMLGNNGGIFSVSLLNPITRAQISFPPLPGEITKLPEQEGFRHGSTTKTVLTASPASSRYGKEVFLALLISSRLLYCRLGGDAWTVIELGVPSARRRAMAEFTYFDGDFYVVDNSTGITVIDTNSLKKKYSASDSPKPLPYDYTLHLVESSGDLLLVVICKKAIANIMLVFKLDRSNRKMKWESLKESIGDRALFVSQKNASISIPSQDFMGNRRDLICFASDDSKHEDMFGDVNFANICVLDIADGSSYGSRPYFWKGARRPRSYWKNLTGLTWIIPSLC